MPDDGLPAAIGRPATRALQMRGVMRLSQLTEVTRDEVASWHGVGPKALAGLEAALAARGLGFLAPP